VKQSLKNRYKMCYSNEVLQAMFVILLCCEFAVCGWLKGFLWWLFQLAAVPALIATLDWVFSLPKRPKRLKQ